PAARCDDGAAGRALSASLPAGYRASDPLDEGSPGPGLWRKFALDKIFCSSYVPHPFAWRIPMMKLYWTPQSRAFRALWLMEEAGRPYERVRIDIRKGEQAAASFRAVNPMMKVPALTDGEASVAESAAICAYVAERVPEARLAPPLGDPLRG